MNSAGDGQRSEREERGDVKKSSQLVGRRDCEDSFECASVRTQRGGILVHGRERGNRRELSGAQRDCRYAHWRPRASKKTIRNPVAAARGFRNNSEVRRPLCGLYGEKLTSLLSSGKSPVYGHSNRL